MTRYDYKVIEVQGYLELEQTLNRWAEFGWEPYHVTETARNVMVILRREPSPKGTQELSKLRETANTAIAETRSNTTDVSILGSILR